MSKVDIDYDHLPADIKHNLTPEQWVEAQSEVVLAGDTIPDSAPYLNLKNGFMRQYMAGEKADGDLFPVHNISGGHGKDSTQFHTQPPGAITDPAA